MTTLSPAQERALAVVDSKPLAPGVLTRTLKALRSKGLVEGTPGLGWELTEVGRARLTGKKG